MNQIPNPNTVTALEAQDSDLTRLDDHALNLRLLEAEMAKEPERPICPRCKHEIDLEVCWCGDWIRPGCYHDNHNPVPMGCTCGYAKEDAAPFPKSRADGA